jgi:hypothetical protein
MEADRLEHRYNVAVGRLLSEESCSFVGLALELKLEAFNSSILKVKPIAVREYFKVDEDDHLEPFQPSRIVPCI